MPESLRILILEDNPADAELAVFELQEAGFIFTPKIVTTKKDFIHELQEFLPDLILSDYDLPRYNGALALTEARKRCPDTPFILVTGAVSEDRAIEILTQGAKDYVLKNRLQQRLAPAVRRALAEAEEHRARKQAEAELRDAHRNLERLVEERTAALQKSEVHYRSLFDNMMEGFAYCRMIFDQGRPQDFIYLDVNRSFESLTGLKNVTGKRVSEVIPGIEKSDADLLEAYGRVALTGEPERFERYVKALQMWFSVSVYSPEKEHFVAVFDVITARKRIEEALQEREEQFRTLADTIPNLAWWANGDGYITWYNRRWYEYTGTTPEQMEGWGWQSVHDPEMLPKVLERWTMSIATGQPFEMEFPLRGTNGGFRIFLTRVLPLKDSDGRVLRWFGTNTDISELQDSEKRYRRLFESAKDGILILDANTGKVTDVNPFLLQLLGYSYDELYGQHIWELGVFKDIAASKDAFKTLQDNEYIRYDDLPLETRDGKSIAVEFVSNVYLVDHSKVVQCNIRDITKRKKAEEAVRLSEEKFSVAFANNAAAIALTTLDDGRFLDVNETWLTLNGYDREEVIGRSAREMNIWPTAENANQFAQELKRTGFIRGWMQEFRRKSGEVFATQLSAQLLTIQNEKVILSTLVDVTERKRIEEALRKSEERYRDLINALHDWIWQVDKNGVYIYASPQVQSILGYSPHELAGKKPFDLMPDDEAGRVEKIFNEIVSKGQSFYNLENVNRHKDGRLVYLETNGIPFFDEKGNLLGYRGMDRDITDRRLAMDKLRDSEERFRALITASSDAVYCINKDWSEMRQLRDRNYIPDTEEPPRNWLQGYIPPDDRPFVKAVIDEAIRNKSVFELEHRVLRSDGTSGWAFSRAIPILDENGEIIEWFGAASDITERKEMEKVQAFMAQTSIGETGEPFFNLLARYLAESLGMDFVCIDRLEGDGLNATTVAVWSDGHFEDNVTYALKDTPCGDVVGKTVCCFPANVCQFFPRDQVLQDLLAQSYIGVTLFGHTGLPIGLIAVIGRRPLKNRALAENILKLVAVRAAGEMERLDAENALRESEEQFRTILEKLPVLISLRCTEDSTIAFTNTAYDEAFGLRKNEVIGKQSPDIYYDPAEHREMLDMVREHGFVTNYELSTKKSDGTPLWLLSSVQPAIYNGKPAIIGASIDITKRKLAEEVLNERTRQLEDANSELESFSYSVSHDLRAPLRAIDGFSRKLEREYGDKVDEKVARTIEVIRNNARIMGKLIDDLLSFSRVQKTGMNITVVDMDQLVKEVLWDIREANRERDFKFNAISLLPGCGDRALIRQVFFNLISNAVKFTKDRKPAIIEMSSYPESGKIVYCVKDNGAGFDMSYYNKLFGVFQRLHSHEEYEGTGIGLAIVLRIIKRHGGEVWAEGEVDKGAAFYFSLPSA